MGGLAAKRVGFIARIFGSEIGSRGVVMLRHIGGEAGNWHRQKSERYRRHQNQQYGDDAQFEPSFAITGQNPSRASKFRPTVGRYTCLICPAARVFRAGGRHSPAWCRPQETG